MRYVSDTTEETLYMTGRVNAMVFFCESRKRDFRQSDTVAMPRHSITQVTFKHGTPGDRAQGLKK
jgi:hypothetical protein